MKILVVSQYWAPENGVPQRRWSWLSEYLIQCGHEIMVLAPRPHYERSITWLDWFSQRFYRSASEAVTGDGGEKIVRTGFVPTGNGITGKALNQLAVSASQMWMAFKSRSIVKDFDPDLVIGTVPAIPTAFVAYIFGRRFEIPYVIDLRDAWPDLFSEARNWNAAMGSKSIRQRILEFGPLQLVTFVARRLLNWVLDSADGILVTSSYLGESIERRLKNRLLSRKPRILTLRNVFPPETQYERRQAKQLSSQLHVLYAGTLGRAQDLSNVISAAAICREKGVNVALKFAGAGAARKQLVEMAKDTNLEIEFVPRTEADKLEELYRWADTALVHLADWHDLQMTVPSKTYELMNAGIHITAVVRGETSDIVTENRAGHVVPPRDPVALAELWGRLHESSEYLRVGKEGRQWVRERRAEAPRALELFLNNVLVLSRD